MRVRATRVAVICGGAAVVMLITVALRAQATHLHYAASRLERRCALLNEELRERQLELARRRSPQMIRTRLADLRLDPNRRGDGP